MKTKTFKVLLSTEIYRKLKVLASDEWGVKAGDTPMPLDTLIILLIEAEYDAYAGTLDGPMYTGN